MPYGETLEDQQANRHIIVSLTTAVWAFNLTLLLLVAVRL